ncbi:hypothetical protein [Dictyobacter arantiisoli]|uniref:Uncharacterized protein n=1 Tax=Dictyobacter arantiisoli TaxID=2014874 RepID=A0A5A5TA11_9CHLR|nr:hypothetical protein [Dictyobacter arantiisoli]GCF08095.1 hypothetical protein KDI_16590 [Dictyobacter arantiisoli]
MDDIRQQMIEFLITSLIASGIWPASLSGGQAWAEFERIARSMSTDTDIAKYYWYATQAEYSAFVHAYNTRFSGR